jgi:VWFA-related protein
MHPKSGHRAMRVALLVLASIVVFCRQASSQAQDAGQQQGTPEPSAGVRPRASVPKPAVAESEGRIKLDVIVTDSAGKLVAGLARKDFTLLDNERPQTISSFEAIGVTQESPIQIILVIDLVNAGADEVTAMRTQLGRYLRQNGGRLANPVLIVLFAEDGLQIQSQPSVDGNALAAAVDQIKASPPSAETDPFSQSLEALTAVADIELKQPGRKLLIWTGKGWPVPKADDPNMSLGQNDANIGALVSLTNKLRKARIVVYGGDPNIRWDPNEGMTNLQKLDPKALALGALALRTGGRGLSRNDLGNEINRVLSAETAYYSLSFDPPATDRPDDYHLLKVVVSQPKLAVRTTAGYYSESPVQ